MCAASPHGAARHSPDEHRNEACRGGGQIKSKRGELTLDLVVWGDDSLIFCGSGLAREGSLLADLIIRPYSTPVGAGLPRRRSDSRPIPSSFPQLPRKPPTS